MTAKNDKSNAGRKPIASLTQQGPQYVGETPPDMAAEQAAENAMFDGYSSERDLVNQILGQAQMADAIGNFSLTVGTSKLAYVKESKAYKSLRGMKLPTSGILTGTWEEFCELLGRSRSKVDEDIDNLRTFGPETLDALSRIGAGYRDLRRLRALPEDSQNALIEVAKSGDKEQLLELAEDLIAREEAAKKKIADERDKAINQYEAREKVVKATQEQITSLKEKLARIPREKPDEKGKAMTIEVAVFAADAAGAVRQLVTGIETLLKHAADNEIDPKPYREAIEHHGAKVIDQIGELIMLLDVVDMPTLPARLRTALDVE